MGEVSSKDFTYDDNKYTILVANRKKSTPYVCLIDYDDKKKVETHGTSFFVSNGYLTIVKHESGLKKQLQFTI